MYQKHMTQEQKQLLLIDLCGRLPYGVKCNVWYGPKSPALNEKDKYTDDILETINPTKGTCTFHKAIGYNFGNFPIEHIKPYLRPMSSMTGKELDECRVTCKYRQVGQSVLDCATPQTIDYLISHHFDYRGLIPMGLALEAKEGMYKTE